jgi:hypothetical protein
MTGYDESLASCGRHHVSFNDRDKRCQHPDCVQVRYLRQVLSEQEIVERARTRHTTRRGWLLFAAMALIALFFGLILAICGVR